MRALTFALAAAAFAFATPAAVATYVFQANLTGAAESPPNASPATGATTVSLDDAAHQLTVDVTFSGLTGTTTASHIHAPTDVPFMGNAGVATELPSFTGFPLGVTAGSYHHVFDTSLADTFNPTFVANNGGTAAGAEAGFLSALLAGEGYLNVHSTTYGAGEIRGFLALVPEPESWALMIVGFGLAGAALRARRAARVKISA